MRARMMVLAACVVMAFASVGCSRTDCIEPRSAEEVRGRALERANELADGAGVTGKTRALFTAAAREFADATLRQRPGGNREEGLVGFEPTSLLRDDVCTPAPLGRAAAARDVRARRARWLCVGIEPTTS